MKYRIIGLVLMIVVLIAVGLFLEDKGSKSATNTSSSTPSSSRENPYSNMKLP
jgi:hypothetical protein